MVTGVTSSWAGNGHVGLPSITAANRPFINKTATDSLPGQKNNVIFLNRTSLTKTTSIAFAIFGQPIKTNGLVFVGIIGNRHASFVGSARNSWSLGLRLNNLLGIGRSYNQQQQW